MRLRRVALFSAHAADSIQFWRFAPGPTAETCRIWLIELMRSTDTPLRWSARGLVARHEPV